MLETSAFYLELDTDVHMSKILAIVQEKLIVSREWADALSVMGNTISVEDGTAIKLIEYKGLPEKICLAVSEAYPNETYRCMADYYSEAGEIHDQFMFKNETLYHYKKRDEYLADKVTELFYKGSRIGGTIKLEETDLLDTGIGEIKCTSCEDFFWVSTAALMGRCPYCNEIHILAADVDLMEGEDVISAEEIERKEYDQTERLPKWKRHTFELPLGIDLPEIEVSTDNGWVADCNRDNTFEINPKCFLSKNQYDAAVALCKACDGWFMFESEEERELALECYRKVIQAKPQEPMWYYSVSRRTFEWINALRERNPKYKNKFYDVEELWSLFMRLGQRSFLEKAECFDWYIQFFGENLKYGSARELINSYITYKDQMIEVILYHKPEQIPILVELLEANHMDNVSNFAYAAAGLIRLGKEEDGLKLYQRLFEKSMKSDLRVEERKQMVDCFMERLSMGYENEDYLNERIEQILINQCERFYDKNWTAKVKMVMHKK